MTYAYGSQMLADGVNYFLYERNYDVSPVKTALYKVSRRIGVKSSGSIQDERVIPIVVRVNSGISLPDLESKVDSLQGGLFQQRQQRLTLHAGDGRYFIADCIGFTANYAPIKGGGYPGSGPFYADCAITFLAQYPFAYAPATSTYDTGTVTLTATGGNTYAFPTFSFSGGGNIFAEPSIRLYNQTTYPAANNTTLTATLLVNHAYTVISVAALPVAASAGDVFVINWGNATQQLVTLSANAAQNATSLSVNNFTSNATYASGTAVDKDYSWTNITITQVNDAQTLVIPTYPSSNISTVNGDFLDIYCDPTLPLGDSIVKNSNPGTLLAFNGQFPVVEPVSTGWTVSITCNNVVPTAELVFTWQNRWLS